ncbi:4-alpha-glucanotransferase [Desulfuromusa kysingii]|uniref:4-alpha-glucanotransferase n=1 Tax=Desulfuromusa kysingii TaxID=37625 RepID=A0A1H3W9X6_9BACT|nr:4-alpha-glucanotransferase [Desulfuromusa kysingii]SDZ83923.1 4-alpha-glucanotransferase [Desulfuromusa kysingii]
MLTQRQSGVLLHPTSLPGEQAIGSLGPEAYDFVDTLLAAGQSVWQLLPLGPIGYGNCPYSSFSAFAGSPLLINLSRLITAGDLRRSDLPTSHHTVDTADYAAAAQRQFPVLRLAHKNFTRRGTQTRKDKFDQFCNDQSYWLDDYALFESLREYYPEQSWQQWPQDIRQRIPAAVQEWTETLEDNINLHKYLQFVFFEQWRALKEYANSRGIEIFGDLPIFVAEDSADVWTNRELFYLDDADQATLVAGVPPDYFSSTGQRWGNPLYRWDKMAEDNYSWWLKRFRWNLELFDFLRVDHFRGFSSCWAIPATEATAENGSWIDIPGEQLFTLLQNELGNSLPLVAEDLGILTEDVITLRDKFSLPGMKILLFAFDSDADNPYLPENINANAVIYTGTHDNNTTIGWWQGLDNDGQQRVRNFLQTSCDDMPWALIETAMSSAANLAIIPLQDILSLPASSRMNIPGTATGNWQWRYHSGAISTAIMNRLKNMSHLYGRNLCIPAEMPPRS